MIAQNVFIVHPTTEQANALKAFIKAMKIKFDIATSDNIYNPEFVAKIKKSKTQFNKGKFIQVKQDDLHNFLGLNEL